MSITLRAKRILTGALAGALVLGLLPAGVASAASHGGVCAGAASAGFPDAASATHQANIDCIAAYGVITGRADGTFGGSASITRGQFATLIAKFAQVASGAALPVVANTFADVTGNVHADNIARIVGANIASGRSATAFAPNDTITRAEAATMLKQAHDALGVSFAAVTPATNFTDVSGTHAANINLLAGAGVVSGKSATTFGSSQAISRAEIATLLVRSANLVLVVQVKWSAPALPGAPVTSANIVTSITGATPVTAFGYSDGTKAVAVAVVATDVFVIGTFTVSQATFSADLSIGDEVVVQKDTPAIGRQTITLTNRVATFYASGTASGPFASPVVAANNVAVIEPVTGVVLRSVDYTTALSTYTVDGASATQAQFVASLNRGDTVAISGAGTAANRYVFALTNRSLSGKVAAMSANTDVTVTATAGFTSEVFTVTNNANTVLTLDGTIVSPNTGNTAAFTAAAVRVNDTITVTRVAGVNTISVTRVASAALSGTVGGDSLDANNNGTNGTGLVIDRLVFTRAAGTAAQLSADDIDQYNLVVDGSTVSAAVFVSQLTVGDAVAVLEADAQLRPKGTITLTNQSLAGPVDKASLDVANNDISVKLNTATAAVLTADIDYTTQFFGGSAAAPTYSVNGTAGLEAAFETALGLIVEGTRTGTIVISRVGTATNYALTTSAAAAATFTVTAPSAALTPALTVGVVFSQPVRYETAAFAATDFVVKVDGTVVAMTASNMAISPALHGAGVVLTITSTVIVVGHVYSVELTSTGAAKMRDKNGTAPAAAIKTVVALA